MSPHASTPRADATLADYLRILRERRWSIALVAAVCAVAALGLSLAQKPSYDATASLAVNDPNQDLSVLGSSLVSSETPLQLASVHAPQVTRTAVLLRVRAELHRRHHRDMSLAALKQAVTVGIDPNSFLVTIDAHAAKAARAAAIANAFARADATLTTAAARQAYGAQAAGLAHKLARLPAATQPSTKAIYTDKLSALQSLSSIATPVQVSAPATVPSSPTSPKTARNTVAALLFGLLLGIALAYGREALDRRLRRPADVEQQFDHPVVGHIRTDALGRAGAAPGHRSNGAGALDEVDAESFRILRHNVRHLAPGDDGRILLVTSAMAEEGKSTVAASLAAANAQAGMRTMLIECDLRRPVLAQRLGVKAKPGLSDYLTGRVAVQEVLQMVAPGAKSTNGNHAETNGNHAEPAPAADASLVCITAGTTPSGPADLLSSARFSSLLAEVAEAYDSVILDCPPLLSVADTLEIAAHASAMLVCVRLRQTTREQARAARAALERLPACPVGLVLTAVPETGDEYVGYFAANTGARGSRVTLKA